MPTVSMDVLIDFTARLFVGAGVPTANARLVAHSLVDANLCGHDSHGVLRVTQYVESMDSGRILPDAPLDILDESSALLAADANWGLGQVQLHRLIDRLIPKVKSLGIAAGSLRSCGHTGRLGEYAERVANDGFALMATVNSHGSGNRVAPPGGIEGRISTNPLCIGAPCDDAPLVLDMGTSVCAEGKIRSAYQKGERIPEGWLIDSEGKPTTDPATLYADPKGTILPLGGPQAYKGFGLGLMLDVLAGAMSGGECTRPNAPPAVGNAVFIILLDTRRFGGEASYLEQVRQLADNVRTAPRAAGVDRIDAPGDPEHRSRLRRMMEGVPIPDVTWKKLEELAQRFGVVVPLC